MVRRRKRRKRKRMWTWLLSEGSSVLEEWEEVEVTEW
jgi:hypothetical protein